MAEWLLDEGIGEHRAALVVDGAIIEAAIDRRDDRLRIGQIVSARLGERVGGGAWIATAHGDAILEAPPGVSQGRSLLVEIVREAIPEPGRLKPPRARASEASEEQAAPSLAERLAGGPVRRLASHGPDLLEAAGWSALIEEAETGEIAFPGGTLRFSPTPAMALFDVDGAMPPAELAIAGASAAALAIRRLAIGGSIGIDLPTLPKADRAAPAAAIDAILPRPFERTAVNGFGFVQIVRPRPRASIPEIVRGDPALTAALSVLRAASRSIGAIRLVAAPAVVARLEREPGWIAALARHVGGAIALQADPARAISASHVQNAR